MVCSQVKAIKKVLNWFWSDKEKQMKKGYLSTHFHKSEFECRCGCGKVDVSAKLVAALEDLRELAGGRPITIISPIRCEAHNLEVGGKPQSQHLLGTAADVVIKGLSPAEVAELAEKIPAFRHGGIGRYKSFTHLDVRGYKARWNG